VKQKSLRFGTQYQFIVMAVILGIIGFFVLGIRWARREYSRGGAERIFPFRAV
jgi:hypothetical protein